MDITTCRVHVGEYLIVNSRKYSNTAYDRFSPDTYIVMSNYVLQLAKTINDSRGLTKPAQMMQCFAIVVYKYPYMQKCTLVLHSD